MSIETAAESYLAAHRLHLQSKGIVRRLTISNPKPPGKTRAILGTIGEGDDAVVGQEIPIGTNETYAAGEVYELHGSGDPNDPQWRIGRQLVPRNPAVGADLYAALPAPVWSTVVNPDDSFSNPICLGTEADLNATTGANGEPMALIHAIYRSIVPGSYSAFKDYLQKVQLQVKAVSASGWRNIPTQHVTPSRPIRITLNASLSAGGTSVTIALPSDVTLDELIPGYYVHWRIDGEIVIAKAMSAVLLTVLAVSGRGVEGTTAVSHSSGAQIELLSGVAHATGMDPGVSTQARIAFVDGHDVAGPPSVTNVLTTWKRTTIPVPSSLAVEMRSNGFKLAYGRPLDPADGVTPMTQRFFYKIYRNTSASTSGAKVVRARNMNLNDDIAASDWDTDATRKDAGYFGVQTIDGFGNVSSTGGTNGDGILWAHDTTPPPVPLPESWYVQSLAYAVKIAYLLGNDTNAAASDVGFDHMTVYRATDTSGTGAVAIGVFGNAGMVGGDLTYEPPFDKLYYYQIASVDFAGNPSALGTGDRYWKRGLISYPEVGLINGNFQVPGPVRTVTDISVTNGSYVVNSSTSRFIDSDAGTLMVLYGVGAAGADIYVAITAVVSPTQVTINPLGSLPATTGSGVTAKIGDMPLGWGFGPPSSDNFYPFGIKSVSYPSNAGINGNWAVRIVVPAGTYNALTQPVFGLIAQRWRPYNSGKTQNVITASVKVPNGVYYTWWLIMWGIAGDYPAGVYTSVPGTPTIALGNGAWQQISATINAGAYFAAGGAPVHNYVASLFIGVTNAGGTYPLVIAADRTIDIDDFSSVIS